MRPAAAPAAGAGPGALDHKGRDRAASRLDMHPKSRKYSNGFMPKALSPLSDGAGRER